MWSVGSRLSMAAKKKKRAPPPTAAQSSSSDDADQSNSHSDPNPNPPVETLTPQKRSEPEDSSEEDEDENKEEKQEETVEIQAPKKSLQPKDSSEEDEPQSPPEKQKDQPSTKKSSAVQRMWSLEDEMTLLRALSNYQLKNGNLPPSKDYASFISTISNSISFNVTVKQLYNKMRTMRFNYNQNKKKGSNIKFSTSHDKAVFDLCTKLYESKEGASQKTNRDAETKHDSKRKKRSSHFYLEGLIKDMISTQKSLRLFSTVEEVVQQIGESRVHDLEAKSKMLQMDAIKLHAREEILIAELFEILADEMVDD